MTDTSGVVRGNGVVGAPSREVQAQFGLAHAWLQRGHNDRARAQFRKVLELDPDVEDAWLRLADLAAADGETEDLIATCQAGIRRFPNQSRLHKHLVAGLRESVGHGAVLDHYGLAGPQEIAALNPDDLLACLVVRNEAARLPRFLDELRALGVTRVFAIDNGSTDATVALLDSAGEVSLWQTDQSFNSGNFGSAWFEALLAEHGEGHWVVMLDADEVLCHPGREQGSLRGFADELDANGKTAACGLMLDMYSEMPLSWTHYEAGQDFLQVAPFFDRTTHHEVRPESGPFGNYTSYYGGLRHRIFGTSAEYLVTKTPLLKYSSETILGGGQHWTNHVPEAIAHDSVCVLHFKYFSTLIDHAHAEAVRGEHSEGGRQYKAYSSRLANDTDLTFFDSAESVRFESSQQLLDLGILAPLQPAAASAPAAVAGTRSRSKDLGS